MKHIVVHTVWDGDADVWVASSEDIQGLAIEADTIDALRGKVVPAIEDLIELNGADCDLREIPVEIRAEEHTKALNPCY